MNNSDLIVAILKRAGISHGFGIPSGPVLPLMEAMRSGGIEFVLTAHEGSAGFAADAMARMTGRPGLAIATLGPGATNLATGVGGAFLDRSPMIAITCNLNRDQIGRRIQMYIDHHALFRPIAKASFSLCNGAIGETVVRALRMALTEPQGPIHLDLPEDVALAPTIETVPDLEPVESLAAESPSAIAQAAELIAAARHPVAVIGATAMRMQHPAALRAFVERVGLPFATTTMAKGLIDEDHPQSIGCIERACRQVQRAFLRRADLIVGIGYDTIEVEYEAWIGTTPLLHLDIEALDADETVQLRQQVIGDLDKNLASLLAVAPCNGSDLPTLAEHRRRFQAALRPFCAGLTPHRVIDVARSALARDGILCFDVGAHTHQIASQWPAHGPRQFVITNGWSSMGFGLPAAIGAKIADPDRPTICILGDGCFQMSCGELAVAERLALRLPVIVLNDNWLSLMRVKQLRRQLPSYGTELWRHPYSEPPAHYFGVPAVGVRDEAALADALSAALAAGGPTVIEAFVDSDHYAETVYD